MTELGPGDLRDLASSIRSGLPARAAIEDLGFRRPRLSGVAHRARMGAANEEVLRNKTASDIVDLHESAGGDLAAMLDGEADRSEARLASHSSATAASSGALLSMKLIAALPFLWLPVVVREVGDLTASEGIMILAGLTLGAAGWMWMTRLVPRAPAPDPAERLMTTISHLLAGGAGMEDAMALAVSSAGDPSWSGSVRARHGLGATWSVALEDSPPDGLDDLIEIVRRCEVSGEAPAAAIAELAVRRRADLERSFERRLKRAPVLMVLPLGLCVLPSFLLVAVGPAIGVLSN